MPPPDRYRRIASVYDLVIEPMQAGVRSVAISALSPQSGWHVLDIGCGTGTGFAPYLDAGCTVAGVDVSEAMLERARRRFGDRVDLRLADGGAIPFPDNGFDLVTSTMVLHEVPEEQRPQFVTEMARVAKPDGKLMLIDFRFGSLRGWRGPTMRAVSGVIERLSGHYSHYQSFKASGGVPGVLAQTCLTITTEKIVAGGNVAIYVAAPC